MKILIVKMSSLGDVVHTIPLAGILKKGIPGSVIDWVVNEEYASLLEGNPAIRKVIPFKRKAWLGFPGVLLSLLSIRKFAMGLKKERYDLVIDVQGLFKSALVVRMASGEKDMGFSNARELAPLFYDVKVFGDPKLHAVERYLLFAKELGLSWTKDDIEFNIPVSDADKAAVAGILKEQGLDNKRFAVFCPFSRWETKMWPEERFHALEALLEQQRIPVVWTGGRSDALKTKAAHDLIGKLSVRQLYELVKKSAFVVTCDSGAMHIAAAAGAPVFAIFGPTSEEKTGPYSVKGRSAVIRRNDLPCAPCFSRKCEINKACLDIPAEDVMRTIQGTITL